MSLHLPDRLTTVASIVALFTVILVRNALKRRQRPLPPGPKGYPPIGNIFDFPGPDVKPWIYWANYKKLYGSISSITVLGTTMIIINDYDLATNLLKRDTVADRPYLTFMCSMVGWQDGTALMRYGETHKIHRRYIHRTIGTRETAQAYEDVILKATHKSLYAIMMDSSALRKEIQRQANHIILHIAYGYAVDNNEDLLIKAAEDVANDTFVAMAPGAFLVDLIPFLRHIPSWFPGAGFQHTAELFRGHLHKLVQLPHDFVKQQISSGTARPSIDGELLSSLGSAEGSKEHLIEDFHIKWSSAMIFLGGHETTVAAAHSFFLAMLLNQEVQCRAQEEVDSILGPGPGRLPTSSDRVHMPYVDAVLKEVWRRYSPFQLCMPHATIEDVEFEGYHLPKGSVVWANTWAMNHNPDNFPDPMAFKPERYLQKGEKKVPFNPTDAAFGYGRRACPGRDLGELSLWFFAVMTLATINIFPWRDSKGKEIIPAEEFSNFTVSHPKEFNCRITPRSEHAAAFLQSANDEAPESDAETLRYVRWKYLDINGKE